MAAASNEQPVILGCEDRRTKIDAVDRAARALACAVLLLGAYRIVAGRYRRGTA